MYQLRREKKSVSYCYAEQWCAQRNGRLVAKNFHHFWSTFGSKIKGGFLVGITNFYHHQGGHRRQSNRDTWSLSWGSEGQEDLFESDASFIENSMMEEYGSEDKNCFEFIKFTTTGTVSYTHLTLPTIYSV